MSLDARFLAVRLMRRCGRTVRRVAVFVLLAGCAMLSSCTHLSYYAQAARGQWSLVSGARPIDDWLADPTTDARLKARLERARQIRQFAVAELGLPDNNSYKRYAALARPYVLWNVVATPELSLTPLQWCFPVAGCVSYRGYFDLQQARVFAQELREQGHDVQVAGVPAYSTLGWFDDPLTSSFIDYPDPELARLVFHELAHQVLYVAGDTPFNEAFASVVEEVGVQRWLVAQGDAAAHASTLRARARKQDFLALLRVCRDALDANYRAASDAAVRRANKARIFAELTQQYQQLKLDWGGYQGYDRWFAEPLGNAHLAAVAAYTDYVPALGNLLGAPPDLPAFYARARTLAALTRAEREAYLRHSMP